MTCYDCECEADKGYRKGKRWYCDDCWERRVTNRKRPARFMFPRAVQYKVRSTPPPEPEFTVTSSRPRDPLNAKGHGIINAERLTDEDVKLIRRAVNRGWNVANRGLLMKRVVSRALHGSLEAVDTLLDAEEVNHAD